MIVALRTAWLPNKTNIVIYSTESITLASAYWQPHIHIWAPSDTQTRLRRRRVHPIASCSSPQLPLMVPHRTMDTRGVGLNCALNVAPIRSYAFEMATSRARLYWHGRRVLYFNICTRLWCWAKCTLHDAHCAFIHTVSSRDVRMLTRSDTCGLYFICTRIYLYIGWGARYLKRCALGLRSGGRRPHRVDSAVWLMEVYRNICMRSFHEYEDLRKLWCCDKGGI